MADPVSSKQLSFGTELTIAASTFDGTAKLIGILQEIPAEILFMNDTSDRDWETGSAITYPFS